MRRFGFILLWIWSFAAIAAEVIPPSPDHYFNDYAHVVDAATANQLDGQLETFEKSTGNQVVVAVYPKMQSDSAIDDYAVRVFRAWKVGQKDKNNGAVLFVFTEDRKMFIEVGYGLEGVLPDALCKQITEFEIKPHFKNGDYTGGLVAGVNSILAATRNEYKGNGTTVYQRSHGGGKQRNGWQALSVFVFIFFIIVSSIARRTRRSGWIGSSGGWGGFYGGGGGGFGGGGGGGFSGGGGSSGGGGAGSSW